MDSGDHAETLANWQPTAFRLAQCGFLSIRFRETQLIFQFA
jgi:hypothetical protein